MRNQLLRTSTLLFFLFIIATDVFGREQVIRGKVFDAEDGKPLPGVTVKAADSQFGSYTNSIGEFSLKLPPRTHTLIFTMVGKERLIQEISYPEKDSIYIEVSLEGSSVLKNEVTVIAEDPGARLMRLAIDKKQKYRDSLDTYRYMLYTKFVASTDTITAGRKVRDEDTTIVSILESLDSVEAMSNH